MKLRRGFSNYIVKVKKNVFVEEDPKNACRNYPNLEFSSYGDCDDDYMRNSIEAVAPGLNLIPPWLTDNLDNVTTEPILAFSQILGEIYEGLLRSHKKLCYLFLEELEALFYGYIPSDCPLPCTTVSTETKFTSSIDGDLGFVVSFEKIVEVNIRHQN